MQDVIKGCFSNFFSKRTNKSIINVIIMKTQLLSFTLFLLFSLSFSVAQDVNKQSDLLIHSTSSLSVSNISFYAENKGPVVVRAYSIDGKQVAVINQNLNSGKATFSIELPKGIYIVNGKKIIRK